jgi:hypothetical protein
VAGTRAVVTGVSAGGAMAVGLVEGGGGGATGWCRSMTTGCVVAPGLVLSWVVDGCLPAQAPMPHNNAALI